MRLKKDLEIKQILKLLCPGTPLREGIENILRAKTGGLLVLGDDEETMKIADGGFTINSEYSPSYVYELAKMDGAIILSNDLKKIVCANTQLVPDPSITTFETGTRHRNAHRAAKQTGNIIIAISQRRNMITVYKGDINRSIYGPRGVPQREKTTIRPGAIGTTSPRPKTAYGLHPNCVMTSPNTEAPHTPYASPMR